MSPTPADPLSDDDAVAAARRHLEAQGLGPALAGRSASVSRQGGQTMVRFAVPAGDRGGDFTLTLDGQGRVVAEDYRR